MTDFNVSDDLSDSKYINEPGNYHLCVTGYNDPPVKSDGTINSDAHLDVLVECLESTVPGQRGKTAKLTLYPGKPSHKDGGKFANQTISRFYLATGLINPSDAGKSVKINHEDLKKGRHFLAKLEVNEKGYPGFAGHAIYHPDDPVVINWPKDKNAMALPGSWRRSGRAAGSNGAAASPAPSPAASKPTAAQALAGNL